MSDQRRWARQVFNCPECGVLVDADECGCCATCGRDCTVVLIEVCPVSELDAALAERDALKIELAARQDSFSMDRHIELMQAHEKALAELAEVRERAERLHKALREDGAVWEEHYDRHECVCCNAHSRYPVDIKHAPDCPAAPGFLTQPANDARRQPATEGGENA